MKIFYKKSVSQAGEMAQWLTVLAALPKDLRGLVSSNQVLQLTTASNFSSSSSSRGANILFWPLWGALPGIPDLALSMASCDMKVSLPQVGFGKSGFITAVEKQTRMHTQTQILWKHLSGKKTSQAGV